MGRALFWDSMVMRTVHTFLFQTTLFLPIRLALTLRRILLLLSGIIRFLGIVYLASSYSGLFWPPEL